MATPDWIAATEKIIGASHPTLADTKNRCVQTIQTMLEVEHSSDGIHSIRATRLVGEIDTFTGNGAARTITLSNSGLTPKKVIVWEAYNGTELISNNTFDADTTGWAATDCTLASIAGGQSNNCLEITRTGGSEQYAEYTITGLQVGRQFAISFYVKSGTSGDEAFTSVLATSAGGAGNTVVSGSSTGAWVQHNGTTLNATASTMYFRLIKNTATAGTMLFDEVSFQYTKGAAPFRAESMNTYGAIGRDIVYLSGLGTDSIKTLATGSFGIDADSVINGNGLTNYYCVLGIDEDTTYVGDGGAAGSDPTWMTSGNLTTAPMIGSDDNTVSQTTNSANAVESEIWTQFIEEHSVAGAHSITIESARIISDSYTGAGGGDDRIITLSDSNFVIKYLVVLHFSASTPVKSVSASMTSDNTKLETTAAFQADYIQDISSTGQFTVGTQLNQGSNEYHYIAIGIPS